MSKDIEKKMLKQQQELLDAFAALDVTKIEAWKNKTTPQIQALKEMIAEAEDILFTPGKSVSELNDAVNQFKKILDEHRIKGTSKRKGKTFPTEITYKVTDMLECYWKRELPINPLDNHQYGVNDYFTHIAETVEMTFDNVKKIEQKYRPKHFSPEK